MGILSGNTREYRPTGGILGRQQREEKEQKKYIRSQLPEVFNPMQISNNINERFAVPDKEKEQPRDSWVQKQLERDRNWSESKGPVLGTINRLLEPISTVVYGAQSLVPGVDLTQEERESVNNWVDDRLAMDRKNSQKEPFRSINSLLEPLSRDVYTTLGSIKGLSSFQKGAGDTLGVQTFTAPEVGPAAVNIPARLTGNLVGGLTNPTNLSQGLLNAPLQVGKGVAQSLASKSPVLANKYAQKGIEGAVAGGIQGGVISGARGDTDLDEMALSIGLGAGLGAAGDIALTGAGSLIKYGGNKVTEVAEDILGNQLKAANAIEAASQGIPTNRLKVQSNTDRLNAILEEIKPIVDERITPTSNVYETALQVAKERGYNLAPLLEGNSPKFTETAEKLRLGGVAGAIEPPSNVKFSIKNDPFEPALPKASQDMETLGISPFSKKGKYANPEDTRTYIATKTDRDPLSVPRVLDNFYTKNVDNIQRINQFDKYIEKAIGRKLNADEKAYYLALNSRGSDMTSRHILTERLVDSRGNVVGNSLKGITSQIPKRAYTNFIDYQIARHAVTRMARGEKVYNPKAKMDLNKVQQKIADYEQTYPQFKQIADQLYDWDRKLGESWLVDTGLIPPEMYAAWREANPNWTPMQRKFTELEKRQQSRGAGRGFSNQNNPVKKYSPGGSERDIVDPIESRIEYTDRYVKTAKRNEVMQTVYNNLMKNPEELDGFATVLKREKIDPNSIGEDGIDGLISSLDDEFNKALLKKTDLDKDNVISALVNGERVYMKVNDPDFLDALTNLTPQAQNAVIEASRKVTGAMKLLTTGVNPIFGLTRNIFRDIPEAYIYSKSTDNPFRFAWDMLDGFVSVFADGAQSAINGSRQLQKLTPESFRNFLNQRSALYKDYKAVGGGHSSPAAANRNLLAQSKRELLPQNKKGLGLIPRAYGALENLNNALESGPRLGEFKRSRAAGSDSYGSKVKGLFEAQDITTNFKRHGQVVKDADAVIPYLNAAVQGLDKFSRAFKDRPVAVLSKSLGMIAAPTIALYAMNYDNPNYKKLNNFTKDNFYLIPTEDGKFVKIPKPRELGVPFGGLLERTMRAWFEDDPEAFRDFADTARNMFAPPVVGSLLEGKNPLRDTVAGPLVELSSNENFMGSPIVPGYLQNLSPRHQYDANTSEIGKRVGYLLNISPKQIDHLIRSYTGVIGQIGLPATTQGATLGDTLTKQMTADPVFSNDSSKYFYELKKEVDTQYSDAKHTGVAPKGYNDDVRKYMSQVASQMGDFTKAIRDVDNSDTLTKAQKKEYKRQLTDQRNELAQSAYEGVRDYLKSIK